jgi:hypothetical protein
MKKIDVTKLKYVGMGFGCLVVATAILRTLGHLDLAGGVAGAIMLSLLVASSADKPKAEIPEA